MDRDNAIRWAGIAAFVMLCLAVLYVATRTTPSEVAATQAADDRSRAALQAAKNWVSYGRTPWEQRYSPLAGRAGTGPLLAKSRKPVSRLLSVSGESW